MRNSPFQNQKHNLIRHITNILGWQTNRKIIVIESDDWGSIRMPDKQTYLKCLNKGLSLERNPYNRFDTLASSDDLSALFEVLSAFKDCNGNSPVITANTVVANPDFEKIETDSFTKYHYVPFTETLNRYYPKDPVFDVWKDGIAQNIWHPQFHGREHVNIAHWLKALQSGNKNLIFAFENQFWGLPQKNYFQSTNINIQASFDAMNKEEVTEHKQILISGLKLFRQIFNYQSLSFIPNNFIFDKPAIVPYLIKHGINVLQGMRYHLQPIYDKRKHSKNMRKLGVSDNGVVDLIRNCIFEPSLEISKSGVIEKCMNDIRIAFFWKKPAIITTHRLNFIGTIEESNRTENLRLFKLLLNEILKRWPDVEFMTSEKLGIMIKNNKK
jgi:hypothetical protein